MKEVSCVAVKKDSLFLMGKRRDNGRWTNPGGHLEEGEDPKKGAVRELFEETGIEAKASSLRHLVSRQVKPDLIVHGFLYEPKGEVKSSMKGDPDLEVKRWQWVDPEKIKDEELHVPRKDNVLIKAMEKQAMSAFWDGFEKKAKIDLSDVENHLDGFVLTREDIPEAQRMVDRLNESRLGLKHPWLTGIPTVGLWPLISHGKASKEVADHIWRNNPAYSEAKDRRDRTLHQRRKETLEAEIADRQALAKERMIGTAALAGMSIADSLISNRYRDAHEKKALQQTRIGEDAVTAGTAMLPFGTTLHTALKDEKGGDRGAEWAGRMGGSAAGTLLGMGIGSALSKKIKVGKKVLREKDIGPLLGRWRNQYLGGVAGGVLGEVAANRMIHSGKYDEKGRLKKEYGGRD